MPQENRHDALVRHTLAAHLDVAPEAIAEAMDLDDDLGLDALDLVLIALALEERVGAEFPLALLESVTSVRQLSSLVGTWIEVVAPGSAFAANDDDDGPTWRRNRRGGSRASALSSPSSSR